MFVLKKNKKIIKLIVYRLFKNLRTIQSFILINYDMIHNENKKILVTYI